MSLAAAARLFCAVVAVSLGAAGGPGQVRADALVWTEELTVARAIATSPLVQRAEANLREAHAKSTERKFGFLPDSELRAGYTRLSLVPRRPIIESDKDAEAAYRKRVLEIDDPETRAAFAALSDSFTDTRLPLILNQTRLQASLSLPLTSWFAEVLPNYRGARGFERARAFELSAERVRVAWLAREAFFALLGAKAALEVSEASLEAALAQHQETLVQVRGGALLEVEAMRTEARVALANVALTAARGELTVQEHALRALLHVDASVPLPTAALATPSTGELESLAELEKRALQQRPDVLALEALIETETARKDAAGASGYPQLSMSANVYYLNPNPRVFPQRAAFDMAWDVGAVVSWSPTELARARAREEQASARRAGAIADAAALRDEVRKELAVRLSELSNSHAMQRASALAEAAAQESHRVLLARLQGGDGTLSAVLDAHRELTAARIERVRAQTAVGLAGARLRYALGQP